MADKIQVRRDTASNWTSANPTLLSGEIGYETDTQKIKIGDASTAWTSLAYTTLGALGYASLTNPTFNGTVTSPTINASTVLQIGGTAITSTAAELNILDGVTATNAELNLLDGVTSTTAELNLLDGVTATTAELNYVDGVTSNIQTQLDAAPAPKITATASGAITAGKPCKINSDGTVSQISSTALDYDEIIIREMTTQHYDDREWFGSSGTRRSASHASIAFDNKRNQFVAVMWDSMQNNFMQSVGLIVEGRIYWQTVKDILPFDNASSGMQPDAGTVMWYDETHDRLVFVTGSPSYHTFTGTPNRLNGTETDYNWAPIMMSADSLQVGGLKSLYGNAEFFNGRGIFVSKEGSNAYLHLNCITLTSTDFISRSPEVGATATRVDRRIYQDNNASFVSMEIAIDKINSECMCYFISGTSNAEWQFSLEDISGTGSPTNVWTSGALQSSTAGAYDDARIINIGDRKYFVFYTDKSGDEYQKARILSLSSGSSPTATWGTPITIDTSNEGEPVHALQLKDGRIWVKWNQYGCFCTVSGTTITKGSNVSSLTVNGTQIYGSQDSAGPSVYSPASDVAVICGSMGGEPFAGHSFGFSTTTADPDTYIGIAQGTVSNSATATIDIIGGANNQQSGQTTGKKYYVHYDGTLGTDFSDVYAGMSTSATKLLVKG